MKSDKATVRKRVEEVLRLRLLGAEFLDIRQHASEQGWQVSDRQLWRYIALGDKILAETLDQDRDRLVRRHVAQRRALYARAVAVSDYRTALAVLKDEGELLKLYPPKRVEASGPEGGPMVFAELTDDERANALAALMARMGQGHGGPDLEGPGEPDGCPVGETRGPDDPGGDASGPLATDVAPLAVRPDATAVQPPGG
jgi:hypothetical protein